VGAESSDRSGAESSDRGGAESSDRSGAGSSDRSGAESSDRSGAESSDRGGAESSDRGGAGVPPCSSRARSTIRKEYEATTDRARRLAARGLADAGAAGVRAQLRTE
jgi:hypothetical protein